MTDEDEATEYVATHAAGWGRADDKEEAIKNSLNAAPTSRMKDDADLTLNIVEVRGEWSVDRYGVEADEIVSEETIKVPKRYLEVIDVLNHDVEIVMEGIVIEDDPNEYLDLLKTDAARRSPR